MSVPRPITENYRFDHCISYMSQKLERIKILIVVSHTYIVVPSEREVINSAMCWTAYHSRVYVLIFVKDPKQRRLGREDTGGGCTVIYCQGVCRIVMVVVLEEYVCRR